MGAPVKFLENNGECLILNTYIFHEYILSGIIEILLKVVLNTINPFKRCKMIFGQLKTVWVSISSYISIIYIYIYVCGFFSSFIEKGEAMIFEFYLYISH